MSEIETVLIVGGGIAGLTLGRALHREGLTVELIERSTEWRAEGGGIAASPTACAYCAPLASMAQWSGPGNVRGGGASATRQATSFLEALWGDVGPFIGIERTRLQQILVAGVEGVRCRLGTFVLGISQHDDRVSVAFSDGRFGNYDLVVGADGITSAVRSLVFDAIVPSYTGAMAWRSVTPIRPRGLAGLQFLLGEGCFFGLCPVGEGHTTGLATLQRRELTSRWSAVSTACAATLPGLAGSYRSISQPLRATSRSTAPRSIGSRWIDGTQAGSFWSVTLHMRVCR